MNNPLLQTIEALAKEKGIEPRPRFLESTLAALDALGLTKDRIHHESYG